MAEVIQCPNPNCHEDIDLKLDAYKDAEGNIYCCKCDKMIFKIVKN